MELVVAFCFNEVKRYLDARFESVERASRRFIASLRLLDPEWLNPILYPNPTAIEQQRLEVFWNRRDQVLERFDELTRRYGEEKVYVFRYGESDVINNSHIGDFGPNQIASYRGNTAQYSRRCHRFPLLRLQVV